jgi:hypothetical protein
MYNMTGIDSYLAMTVSFNCPAVSSPLLVGVWLNQFMHPNDVSASTLIHDCFLTRALGVDPLNFEVDSYSYRI